eukprot:4089191-Heterocapsa_arctica.AAC.1
MEWKSGDARHLNSRSCRFGLGHACRLSPKGHPCPPSCSCMETPLLRWQCRLCTDMPRRSGQLAQIPELLASRCLSRGKLGSRPRVLPKPAGPQAHRHLPAGGQEPWMGHAEPIQP